MEEHSTTESSPNRTSRARGGFAGLLLVLGCLVSAIAVPAWWADHEVSTDSFIRTAEPLAKDPAVQRAIAARATELIVAEANVGGQVQSSLTGLAALGLPQALVDQLRGILEPADEAVRALVEKEIAAALDGPRAVQIWRTALRSVRDAAISGSSEEVVIELAPLVEDVRRRLVGVGLRIAGNIQPGSTRLVLLTKPGTEQAHSLYGKLHTFALPLAITAGVLLFLAIAFSPRRRSAIIVSAAGVAVVMLALMAGIGAARDRSVGALAGAGFPQPVAQAGYDAYGGSLRGLTTWVLGVAIGVAILALLAAVAARPPAD